MEFSPCLPGASSVPKNAPPISQDLKQISLGKDGVRRLSKEAEQPLCNLLLFVSEAIWRHLEKECVRHIWLQDSAGSQARIL